MQTKNKYRAFLIALLSGAFLLTGCGKKDSSSTSSTSSSSDSDAGSAAIEFHNNLVDFTKKARDPLSKIMDQVEKGEEFSKNDGVNAYLPMWDIFNAGNSYDKLANIKLTAPSSFSKDDQAFFNTRIASLKSDTASLKQLVGTMSSYYKAQDYKDDKHKKFFDAKPKIQGLVEKISTNCAELGDKSEEIASAAERETLKKDPIGIYVLNMRDIMDKFGKQVEILTDDEFYSSEFYNNKPDDVKAAAIAKAKPAVDAAEKLGQEIADMATKYRAQDKAALKGRAALAKAYDSFFTTLEKAQGDVRVTIRYLKNSGLAGTPDETSRVINAYKNIQSEHNNFIDAVNNGN